MPRTSIPFRTATVSALACAALLAGGCIASRSSAPRVTKAVTSSTDFSRNAALEKIDSEELNQLSNAFADRYRTLMEDAISAIIVGNPNARQRALANRFLVETTTSAYDIATSGEPFSQVLDLTIMITLTSQVWIDSNRADREFGPERGQILVTALRQAREEAWDIAGRVLLPDQLSALDFMIASWRRNNLGVEDVTRAAARSSPMRSREAACSSRSTRPSTRPSRTARPSSASSSSRSARRRSSTGRRNR
jgi:hypothetical protein